MLDKIEKKLKSKITWQLGWKCDTQYSKKQEKYTIYEKLPGYS